MDTCEPSPATDRPALVRSRLSFRVQIPWLHPPDTSTGGTRVLVPEAPWRPAIDIDELDALLAQDAIRVLDVREDSEFRGGHVPGAIHVPVKRLPDRVGRLKRDKPYAVICASGSRSRGATSFLLDNGFEGRCRCAAERVRGHGAAGRSCAEPGALTPGR